MALKVIGAGFGRTGTLSLKLALEQLGFGPCHHMEEVINDPARHVAGWNKALDGEPDWDAVYRGYTSAVDWPTAAFWRELAVYYPDAKVVLSTRSPESWADSISQTIFAFMEMGDRVPPDGKPMFDMAYRVVTRSVGPDRSRETIVKVFNDHIAAVRAEIPAERLLVFEAKDGWQPLCDFLGVPVPEGGYPRSNNREEFWDLVSGPAGGE